MPVEIRHIRAFHAVAEALHFRHASERLGIAQPALSRTIRDLEEATQVSLFERTTRVIRLTEPGRVFLKHTADLVADLDRAIDLAQQTSSGMAGELRVGVNDYAINGLVPQVVRRFRNKFPDVEVVLIESNSPDSVEMVLDSKFDVAFITAELFQPEIGYTVVRDERIVCVLPSSHSLANKKSVSITDLADEPFIMGRWENWKVYHRLIRDFCSAHGFVPQVIQEVEHTYGIMGMVAAALGVTLHADATWIHAMKDVAVRPLRERPPKVRTSAIWRKDRQSTSPTIDHFIQEVQAVVSEEGTAPS